eukprot:363781-Chlamydomonas_euryale.AAC.5
MADELEPAAGGREGKQRPTRPHTAVATSRRAARFTQTRTQRDRWVLRRAKCGADQCARAHTSPGRRNAGPRDASGAAAPAARSSARLQLVIPAFLDGEAPHVARSSAQRAAQAGRACR